jgi:preprotein translocase subunit SecD
MLAAAWLASASALAGSQREIPLAASDGVRRVLFELRLAETEPVRGLTFEATVKPSGRKIHLHYPIIVANEHVLRADVAERGGGYTVGIALRAEGVAKVVEATARHNGRPIAVVVDGEVVAVLTVRNPQVPDIVFGGDFTRDQAARIAAGLNK